MSGREGLIGEGMMEPGTSFDANPAVVQGASRVMKGHSGVELNDTHATHMQV
jgi:hypothetical protein